MKKLVFSMVMLLVTSLAFSQTHLYENPDFDRITQDHQILAILPFKATVTLRPKQMKEITAEHMAKMELAEGREIQAGMYSWFLKRKKRGALGIDVQDPNTTNALLAKARISEDDYSMMTPQEIAEVLGVDAVIMGTFETTKPMSDGASIALGVLVGFYGSTNRAVANIFIYNAQDGVLLVNYNKAVAGSVGSSTEDLVNILMRKASRRITYTKKV
ncbi:MAG: hypothetical protein JJU34_02045 [Lunatimonas sp.]|uniref:hypothetical protein n=1 Tax=Lunatimonas sp. TaxID=2060141 RepID=UPI00263B3208|nr:hypothetical protein [Lunatimonas sp.]MCC5936040.1 hypothetical protein [Lunatimonas sp.]